MRVSVTGSLALVPMLLGCTYAMGSAGAKSQVIVEAERELDCPSSEITATEQIGGRWKAIGCGREAIYNAKCDHLKCDVSHEDEVAVPWRDRPTDDDPGWRR